MNGERSDAPRRVYVDLLAQHIEPTLEMLARLVDACPEALWQAEGAGQGFPFWQMVYHTVYWLDFWVRDAYVQGAPWAVMTFDKAVSFELETPSHDVLTPAELAAYVAAVREKVTRFCDALDDEKLLAPIVAGRDFAYGDVLMMQVRHVQHHVGLCNAALRAHGVEAVAWLGFGEDEA